MVLARVEFLIGGQKVFAELTAESWNIPNSASLVEVLNQTCNVKRNGASPAAHAAARAHNGKVTFVHQSL